MNKTVFITGASAGIGAACARLLAAQGYRLILAARRMDRLAALSNELKQSHGTAIHQIELDVRDRQAVERSLADLPAAWQQIDV